MSDMDELNAHRQRLAHLDEQMYRRSMTATELRERAWLSQRIRELERPRPVEQHYLQPMVDAAIRVTPSSVEIPTLQAFQQMPRMPRYHQSQFIEPTATQPTTNNEEALIMSKADKDYTLYDFKRLNLSLVQRKLMKLLPDDEQAADRAALIDKWQDQINYLTLMAREYPQILHANYFELMCLDCVDEVFVEPITDVAEINKRMMQYLEANKRPALAPYQLSADDLGAIQRTVGQDAIRNLESELRNTQEISSSHYRDYTRYINEAHTYLTKAQEREAQGAKLQQQLDKLAAQGVDDSISIHLMEQIGLVQSKLNWQFVGAPDGWITFRTPKQTLVNNMAGANPDMIELGDFLVTMKPYNDTTDRSLKVFKISGVFHSGNASPFISSEGTFCFGSGYEAACSQLKTGDLFSICRTIQFLCTSYKSDNPYVSFSSFKSRNEHKEWYRVPTFNTTDKLLHLRFLYGSGDWLEMVDRVLSGSIHLKGDYTQPFVPIAKRGLDALRQYRLSDNQIVVLRNTSLTNVFNDIVYKSCFSHVDYDDRETMGITYIDNTNCDDMSDDARLEGTADVEQYLVDGGSFRVISVDWVDGGGDQDENNEWCDYDFDCFFSGIDRTISFRHHIEYGEYGSVGDNPLLAILRRHMGEACIEIQDTVEQTIDLTLYEGINQVRCRLFELAGKEVLEKRNLTAIVEAAELHSSISTSTIGNTLRDRKLESIEYFKQPNNEETNENNTSDDTALFNF